MALATLMAARLAEGTLPPCPLSAVARRTRGVGARVWLSTLTLPSATRTPLARLVEATEGAHPAAVAEALTSFAEIARPMLDPASRAETPNGRGYRRGDLARRRVGARRCYRRTTDYLPLPRRADISHSVTPHGTRGCRRGCAAATLHSNGLSELDEAARRRPSPRRPDRNSGDPRGQSAPPRNSAASGETGAARSFHAEMEAERVLERALAIEGRA